MGIFNKPSDFRGAGFFKPKDHMDAVAVLFEPKSIAKAVPHSFNGRDGVRDEVIADITIFATKAALDAGTPTDELKGFKVTHPYITEKLERVLEGAMVAGLTTTPTKAGGAAFNLRDVDADTESKVEAYYEKREATIAAAVADAPDFD